LPNKAKKCFIFNDRHAESHPVAEDTLTSYRYEKVAYNPEDDAELTAGCYGTFT